jgi:hypothetical protein
MTKTSPELSRRKLAISVAALALCGSVFAQTQAQTDSAETKRKPDLGDTMQGVWRGNVVSDSKGSSQSDVTVTVTRIGVNRVRVTTDYPRLPTLEINLTRAGGMVMHRNGPDTFLYESNKSPPMLSVTFTPGGAATWTGTREK